MTSWWSRPCGGRDVIRVALPLVVSMMSLSVMHFCDRLFLTWYAEADLAAVGPAGALSWTSVSLPLGIATYATTFVAQYDGAKQPKAVGPMTWQAIWVGVFCIPVYLILSLFSDAIFLAAGHAEAMCVREATYFRILAYSCPLVVMNAAISSFFIGREKMIVVMVVNMFASLLNVGLDYLLVFGLEIDGHEILTAGGIGGAGWATTISIACKCLVLFALFLSANHRDEFDTSRWALNLQKTKRLLKYGVANGFQYCIEGIAITVFVMIIGGYSEVASAATALAFSINMIVFVPILGFGTAVTSLVGQQIGKQRVDLAERAVWTALILGLAYTGAFALAYLLIPEWFLFAHRSAAEEMTAVEDLAIVLLSFVAAYCLFDTVQIVFVSAIKGAGDTMFVVLTTVVSAIGFLAAGKVGDFATGGSMDTIYWWWWALTGWIVFLSIAYLLRFLQGKWRGMTVIEPDLLETEFRASLSNGV